MTKTYLPARMDAAHTFVIVFIAMLLFFFVLGGLQYHEKVFSYAAGLVVIAIIISGQMRPSRYGVSDSDVSIVRGWPFKTVLIPKSQIHEVREVRISWTTIRTFGIGGLFGSGGWFWNKELGRFFGAFTNGRKLVLIGNGGKFVISPENPEEFIADLGK